MSNLAMSLGRKPSTYFSPTSPLVEAAVTACPFSRLLEYLMDLSGQTQFEDVTYETYQNKPQPFNDKLILKYHQELIT